MILTLPPYLCAEIEDKFPTTINFYAHTAPVNVRVTLLNIRSTVQAPLCS